MYRRILFIFFALTLLINPLKCIPNENGKREASPPATDPLATDLPASDPPQRKIITERKTTVDAIISKKRPKLDLSSVSGQKPVSPSSSAPKSSGSPRSPVLPPVTPIRRSTIERTDYCNEMLELYKKRGQTDENLFVTGEPCLGENERKGEILHVVKNVNGVSVTLYTVCFDVDRASLIYTSHVIDIYNKPRKHTPHGNFKSRLSLYGMCVDSLYKAAEQTETFAIFFLDEFTDADINKRYYFSRNHGTPHADFPDDPELTCYFHNCYPAYQSVNSDSVALAEAIFRGLALAIKGLLLMFTGVLGILQKRNLRGELTDVYLDVENSFIEVPNTIFKLGIDEKTNRSVAIFISNNVDMTPKEIEEFKDMCDCVCEQLGFKFKDDRKSGIAVCCSYKDFRRYVNFLPVEIDINSPLLDVTPVMQSRSGTPSSTPKNSPKPLPSPIPSSSSASSPSPSKHASSKLPSINVSGPPSPLPNSKPPKSPLAQSYLPLDITASTSTSTSTSLFSSTGGLGLSVATTSPSGKSKSSKP